jgi:hypothetical protein
MFGDSILELLGSRILFKKCALHQALRDGQASKPISSSFPCFCFVICLAYLLFMSGLASCLISISPNYHSLLSVLGHLLYKVVPVLRIPCVLSVFRCAEPRSTFNSLFLEASLWSVWHFLRTSTLRFPHGTVFATICSWCVFLVCGCLIGRCLSRQPSL